MSQLSSIFDDLDTREVDYVQARANAKSDREALQMIGASYGWLRTRDRDDLLQRALDFKTDNVLKAQIILDQAVEKAARIKADGMDSRNERVKQDCASEIMDRRMGKPTQNVNQKTEHSGSTTIKVTLEDDDSI